MKWSKKFRNPDIDYIELVDYYLSDDCSALGFEMDCGEMISITRLSAPVLYATLRVSVANPASVGLCGIWMTLFAPALASLTLDESVVFMESP